MPINIKVIGFSRDREYDGPKFSAWLLILLQFFVDCNPSRLYL